MFFLKKEVMLFCDYQSDVMDFFYFLFFSENIDPVFVNINDNCLNHILLFY